MVLETFQRWLFLILIILNVSQGSVVFQPMGNLQKTLKQNNEPNYDTNLLNQVSNENYELLKEFYNAYHDKTRLKRETNYEEKQDSASIITDDDNALDKRVSETKGFPVAYNDKNNGVGWWPWQRGLAPVRRSYFVPRLGKRVRQTPEEEDFPYFPCTDLSDSLLETEVTPAEIESLRNALENDSDDTNKVVKSILDDNYDDEAKNDGDSAYEHDICFWPYERDLRSTYSFVPRLGKRAYSFSPRLGKKAYSFSPRLGKKAYSFSPRLGKRKFSFSPRLGKKAYSFSPRLGKRSYAFVPTLNKKAYSFSPRLGK